MSMTLDENQLLLIRFSARLTERLTDSLIARHDLTGHNLAVAASMRAAADTTANNADELADALDVHLPPGPN